jgi:hypothetical protein
VQIRLEGRVRTWERNSAKPLGFHLRSSVVERATSKCGDTREIARSRDRYPAGVASEFKQFYDKAIGSTPIQGVISLLAQLAERVTVTHFYLSTLVDKTSRPIEKGVKKLVITLTL